MDKKQFYYCSVCGNVIEKAHDSGNDLECCGRTMMELEAGVTDAKTESHVPVFRQLENVIKVRIGEECHPMDADHYIEWIEIITNMGISRKYLHPGDKPVVTFCLCEGEKVKEIYAYCNRHKLWKAKCC